MARRFLPPPARKHRGDARENPLGPGGAVLRGFLVLRITRRRGRLDDRFIDGFIRRDVRPAGEPFPSRRRRDNPECIGRRTLRAGFTTVRNLGLFVKTGGYLLDVSLSEAVDAG